uniref:Uncharacterized protein n=1 Tax=Acanthochromis polyacanthus TaxID=80966 RepID=A0A3Q1GK28_9TELE
MRKTIRQQTACIQGSEAGMVLEELQVRLNDRGYTNWLKAGRCLIILRDFLLPFTDEHMRSFHRDLLNRKSLLRMSCNSNCRPRGNKLLSPCRVCSEWQKEIIAHHRQPESTINWDNCSPPHWRTHYWELAKAYMPRGQAKTKDGGQCDASALLNLINHCTRFSTVDPKLVREVIRMRNELMHSCDFRVEDEWMGQYYFVLKHFMQQFSRGPQIASVKEQIEEMLTVDLSIYVSGADRMDSADLVNELQSDSDNQRPKPEICADLVSRWESELLQEMLQEILQVAAEDGDTMTQDTRQLKSLSGFLQANQDLSERFSEELQAIDSLQARQ